MGSWRRKLSAESERVRRSRSGHPQPPRQPSTWLWAALAGDEAGHTWQERSHSPKRKQAMESLVSWDRSLNFTLQAMSLRERVLTKAAIWPDNSNGKH